MNNRFHRREFVKRGLSAGIATAAVLSLPACMSLRSGVAYRELDAVDMARMVRDGDITAKELVSLSRDIIEQLNPQLNAVYTTFYDHAFDLATNVDRNKPFAGVPYLIKDLSEYKGFRTTFGSRATLNHISKRTSPYVNAAVDAGFIPLGKTSTPENGSLPTTEPLALGPTRNPWNLAYSSGGSSGGSAVAVATGMVPVALSTDGGGSIRIPAANCGVFGLKASRGRSKGAQTGPLAFSVRGAISRSVRDSAAHLFYTQQSGDDAVLPPVALADGPAARRLNIGLVVNGVGNVAPSDEVREAILDTSELCRQLGHTVVETRFPDSVIAQANSMIEARAKELLKRADRMSRVLGRPVDEREFEPWTLQQMALGRRLSDQQESDAIAHIKQQARDTNAMFNQYDVLLMPVLGTRPVKLGYIQSTSDISFDEMLRRNKRYVCYTTVFNVSGDPAMSVPLHWTTDGLPIGSQFAAGIGQEEILLGLAYELEAARPWRDRHPPVSIW